MHDRFERRGWPRARSYRAVTRTQTRRLRCNTASSDTTSPRPPGAKDGERFGVLTLDRPERKNPLGPRKALELDNVFDEIRHSAERALVITGANDLILTGRFVGSEEALRIGLVNRVVPEAELIDEAMALAGGIARMPYLGVRHAKEMIRMYNQDNRSAERYDKELERILKVARSEDSTEGIRAPQERRAPRWAR